MGLQPLRKNEHGLAKHSIWLEVQQKNTVTIENCPNSWDLQEFHFGLNEADLLVHDH